MVAATILGLLFVAGVVSLLRQDIDFDTFLNYFALGLLLFVLVTIFYGIIAIHDVPYEIAKKRGHPHQDAIHAAGWVSLFTLHAIWPFLWIWAMLFRPDRGWGFQHDAASAGADAPQDRYEALLRRVEALEAGGKTGGPRKRAQVVASSAPAAGPAPVEAAAKPGTG